jgi:hypothetical protein
VGLRRTRHRRRVGRQGTIAEDKISKLHVREERAISRGRSATRSIVGRSPILIRLSNEDRTQSDAVPQTG